MADPASPVRTREQVRGEIATLLRQWAPDSYRAVDFLREQFRRGLGWVAFAEGEGGLGAPIDWQSDIDDALALADAPSAFERNPLGYGMAAPMLTRHGSVEQRRRFLEPLFTGEEVWCQLFSEPGAGSDLANVSTRAVRDGESWVVTGQKVWTSYGHLARWGMLLARTDPDVAKHRGLTYFVCDMHAPGVEVRPLRQLTGGADFTEVHLQEVVLPDSLRVGEVGAGWGVALTTLNNERYMLGRGLSAQLSLSAVICAWEARADHGSPAARELRSEILKAWVRVEVVELLKQRGEALRRAGAEGPEGSLTKLATGLLNKQVTELGVDVLGAGGALHPGYQPRDQGVELLKGEDSLTYAYLRARANTIEGGTTEILRTTIAQRMLGLPREERSDHGLPWSGTRRS